MENEDILGKSSFILSANISLQNDLFKEKQIKERLNVI